MKDIGIDVAYLINLINAVYLNALGLRLVILKKGDIHIPKREWITFTTDLGNWRDENERQKEHAPNKPEDDE